MTIAQVLADIGAERIRQNTKWGQQNHPDIDPRDIDVVTHHYAASKADIWRQVNAERATPSKTAGRCNRCPEGLHTHTAWDAVLLEEVWEALAEADPAKLRTELIQVAAVAAAWVEAIDRRGSAGEQPEGACALCDVVKPDKHALRDHVLNVHPDEFCGIYHEQPCQHDRPKQPAVAESEACGKCKQPFDPADTRFDGHARQKLTPYCRRCVDLCLDSEIADHRCVICA